MSMDNLNAMSSDSFAEAAVKVLKFLKSMLPFDLWTVTRINGGQQIILEVDKDAFELKQGDSLNWSDSFCIHMVKGEGPNIAPNPAEIAVYANTPAFKNLRIGAYIGVPIYLSDGSLFGTICAIDRNPKEPTIKMHLPMLEAFASVLGTLAGTELQTIKEKRRAERAEAESMMDAITPLYNRRGWDLLTSSEEMRAKKYGQTMSIVSIDLDNLKKINDTLGHAKGGEYIAKAGKAIFDSLRSHDIASRTGGDEFNILFVDSDEFQCQKLVAELRYAFRQAGVDASFGLAQFNHAGTLAETMDKADKRMYEEKRAKKQGTVS